MPSDYDKWDTTNKFEDQADAQANQQEAVAEQQEAELHAPSPETLERRSRVEPQEGGGMFAMPEPAPAEPDPNKQQ